MPGVPFRPVRGLEKTILGLGYTDGHIYIATDTGKMFIDADGINKKPLGGSGAAVMYASALTVAERADGTYNMAWADLDDELSMPKVDDLIINSDGRFFRVLRADQQSGIINCSLIAVSGTGGGGGGIGPGGGGGGEPGQTGIKLEALDSVPTTFIHGQPYNLRFRATAVNDNQVYITYTIQSDLSGNIVLPARIVRSGEIDTIDIGSLLPAESGLAIRVDATSDNDGSASPLIYRYRSSIELLLRPSSNFNPLNVQTGVLEFSCIPVGQGLSKTLRIYVDGNIISELTRENITTTEAAVSSQIPAQSHGVHTIRAVLSTGTGLNEVQAPALEYEVVWNTGESTPLIWFNTNNPTSIVNHDRLNIQYMVYDPATNPATAHFYLNGDEIPTSPLTISYNSSNYETWNVINYRVGNNILNITCGSASRQIEILVNEDTSRDMDIIQGNLTLSLSSMGRSNRENRTSRQIWSYTNKNNETYTAELKNFNWYNNGWISDEDGDTCLRISNGASVRIPIKVLETMRLQNGLAFEIMFKLRNVQSYKTLITTESTEDDDGNVTITKQISTNESVFCRYYNNDIGFCLGTQEAFFKTANNATVSGRYKEDELITISFVIENPSSSDRPLIYMYINGIMSGIIDYKKDTDSFEARAAAIEFISDYCDIDLYNVRVYKGALTSIEVVHNYIADKQDTELYDMNEIVAYNNNVPTIDYNRLLDYNRNHPENPTLPYAVLQCQDGANNDLLPYVKGGKVKCNVTFVNPSLDIAYNNGEVSDEKYITSCPSFTAQGASFDVQGTSSQGYPRRNYKGKFKDCGDTWVYTNGPLKDKPFLSKNEFNGKTYKNYYMDNTQGAEKTFTWKTDYMDSSAVHNTGFASFVKTMYSKHPLTDILPDKYTTSNTNELRTTVYGFPMIVFQLHKDGTYEFIGRYNFNLDKGCNDVIGFERDDEHPYVEGKTIEEVAECWEFCDNQGTRCSFKKVDFAETNDAGELTVNDNFEYRYSFYEDQIDECLDGEGDFAAQNQQQRNAYMLERFANLEKVCKWINSTDTQAATNSPLPQPVTYNGKQYDDDTVEYRLAKFTNEFSKHLDLHYCSIYFIMTELLLCYDSRGKNMMFATWGPHEKDGEYIWYPIFYDIDTQLGVNNSGVPTWDYDINATEEGQFSTSNSVLWNNFWSCFRETIVSTYNQLRKGALNFENLNGYYSFDPEVSGSYAMMGCRPINIMNVDEYFKYIAPTFTGFTTTAGTIGHDGGAHFYCLQGDRALQRELFLRNRFNFIDSAWTAGTYDITQAKNMKFRYNANATGTSDKYVERELGDVAGDDQFIAQGGTQASYPQPLDTTANWTVVPYLKQSVSMYFDEILQPTTPIPFNGEGKVEIEPTETILKEIKNTTNFTQQLVYFGGIQYISSFGDLSLKYLDEITLGEAIRLRDLVIGNDTEGFVNSKLNDNNFKIGDDANNENRKALLEKIVLTNLSGLREIIDVGGSEKLKEFRALGTNIAGVTLSDGTQIEVLHLPSTISQLQIVEPIALTNILTDKTQLKNEDGSWKPGIFIDGVTNKTLEQIGPDDTSAIITFRINGGNMGYDSYKLLKTIVEIKKKMHEKIDAGQAIPGGINPRLSIEVTDVAWTPYRLVESGESVVGGSTYVKKTDHYTFEDYTPGVNWESDTLNGRIYEVDQEKLAEAGEITSLEMFDTFIASYQSSDNYFRSTTEAIGGANTLPTITGDVFINNSEEEPISEDDLKNKYIDANFKDLRIYAKYVDKAYVAKFVEVLDSGVEYEWDTHRYNRNTTSHPEASKVTPTKLHFDFVGWADKPNASEADVIQDWSKYTFSNSRDSYTFYAVYVVHRYTVEFYNDNELVETMKITYNTNLKKCTKIPYKDDSMLELTKCYGFVGWTDDNTRAGLVQNLNSIVDVESLIATKDYKFYACFQEKDVQDNVLSEEYLVCSNLNYNYVDEFDHQYDISGVLIEVKEGVVLSGKITIPNTFQGYPVVALGSMTFRDSINNETLTHVFFEGGGTSLRVFSTRAFYNAQALQYIDIPLLLRVVDQEALSGIPKLPFTDTKNICQLGRTAVGRTGGSSGLSGATLHIGSEMRAMAAQCIQYNGTSYGGGTIQIGEPGQPTKMILSRLENRAFNQNDNGLPSKMVVYIEAGRHDEPQQWINDGKFQMARGYTLDVQDI